MIATIAETRAEPELDWADLAWQITCAQGQSFKVRAHKPLGGGCINQSFRLDGERQFYFLKLNSADRLDMFEAEAQGLQELRGRSALQVPEPICWGRQGKSAYLVLEWLELRPVSGKAAATLGEGLAELHHVTSALHGWSRDNTLGTTKQKNHPDGHWPGFWRDQRLAFQLKLAQKKDPRLIEPGARVLEKVEVLLAGHQPAASLLHGDLWAGNAAQDNHARAVIFDPAVYYGDREAEIAMMELFGGFGAEVLPAYKFTWPLAPGYTEVRRDLYQLYHILNHFNLFGGQYADQALHGMDRLLAQAG